MEEVGVRIPNLLKVRLHKTKHLTVSLTTANIEDTREEKIKQMAQCGDKLDVSMMAAYHIFACGEKEARIVALARLDLRSKFLPLYIADVAVRVWDYQKGKDLQCMLYSFFILNPSI